MMATNRTLLEQARELQALAQTGLMYCKDPFDRERYERIRAMAVDMLSTQVDAPAGQVSRLLSAGYPTPKLDTRAAIFDEVGGYLTHRPTDRDWCACRHIGTSYPKFVLKHYYDLQFSPAVETIVKKDKKNPKRVLRDVKKQLQNNGIGTKSQQALKLQHELKKEEYKSNSKHKKQMDAEQKFKLKQQKKKAKHRGH